MALDPSIALSYRPPQFQMPQIQTPLERFAKVLSLQNLMRQGQLGDIQLQTGRLNLEQLQQGVREKQEFADYLRNEIAKSQQPQPASVSPPQTMLAPPQQPGTLTGVTQFAPVQQPQDQTATPLIGYDPATGTLPAQPPAPAPVVAPTTPTPDTAPTAGALGVQPVPGLAGLGPSFNYGEIATRFPLHGPQFIEQHSKAIDTILKTEDAKAKIIQDNDNRLSALAQGIVDETTKNSAIATAFYEKRITPEQRDYLLAKRWDDPIFKSIIQMALKSEQYFTQQREAIASQIAQNEENRKKALAPYQLRETIAKAGTAETEQALKEQAQDAVILAAAARQGPDALETARAKMDPTRAARFAGLTTPGAILERGSTISEIETKQQHAIQNVLDAAKFAETKKKNDLEFGPGTAESWAANIFENPDAVNEVPANVRSQAQQLFKQKYNLPWPVKLGETPLGTQAAARNALDAVDFIRNAMKNPEIQKQIGPIMGRLGNVQETTGTAVGLSPAAATLAQELRTRMRYFVLQEGKAILGGRVPEKLMQQMEKSSARDSMDPSLIEGAVSGAEGAALSTLDNLDRQRFGGKMRTREQRSIGPAAVPANVQNALAGEVTKARSSGKALIRQLSDGSVWRVDPNGGITPTTAPE